MIFSLIVAIARNRVIGKDNGLPWYLPSDLAYFKRMTQGKPVIMGRKTFQSIGKALPKRPNIVVTRASDFQAPDCQVVHSLNEALQAASDAEEVMLIGGAMLYELGLSKVDRLYLTEVHAEIVGDVFFPEFNRADWHESWREDHPPDDKHAHAFSFVLLERNLPRSESKIGKKNDL